MRIRNFQADGLHIDHFQTAPDEVWCLYGTNTSGIDIFLRIFSDNQGAAEAVTLHHKPEVISFARQQEIFEDEVQKDNSDYLDRIDPGTPARNFIRNPEKHSELIGDFNLQDCLDKGYRQLSSGESRKLLLISALSHNPGLLIIENPYDGLDRRSCRELDHTLATLHRHGHQLLITVTNPGDIPEWCTHLAILQRGHMVLQGEREQVMQRYFGSGEEDEAASFQADTAAEPQEAGEELISLQNGFARYGQRMIFSGLQLTVATGDHTLITGPNGSGKSTLLQIITGDNQNCYANDLRLFGRQRGSGESIWDIKKQMGIVSPDLHRNHYIPGSSLQVVLSGFFDSIGVYRKFTPAQKDRAAHWLAMIGMEGKARIPFRNLSYAEQRLCLIARALIKMPKLLILDEPTQGLDHRNRAGLLDFLETIAERKLSTICFASHRTDEFRPFFRNHIELG